jgi:glutamate---cysteine ligase / carboxylate-amine ligase
MSVFPYGLFERFGIELEYMIVDEQTLDVKPIADVLLAAQNGGRFEDADFIAKPGEPSITWSNELTLHLIELKTTVPSPTLADLPARFSASVHRINELLRPMDARLMPGAMHPWMDPKREKKLWPHDSGEYYAAFDRIFDCSGHGWANLQSMHINLPFSDDDDPRGEFGRLHAAIRLLLPIMPALSASSPIMDGLATGTVDNRLAVYKTNARKLPIVSGRVIPEPCFTRRAYEARILQPIYDALKPHDPEGTLQEEWANSRGCIARFERGSIEIRVLDVQECPCADLAIAGAIIAVLKALVREAWGKPSAIEEQQAWAVEPLAAILDEVIRSGDQAIIRDRAYLELFGLRGRNETSAGELWRWLIDTIVAHDLLVSPEMLRMARWIAGGQSLARRMLAWPKNETGLAPWRGLAAELTTCLRDNRPLIPKVNPA